MEKYYVITTNLDHVGMIPQDKPELLDVIHTDDPRSYRKMSYSNKEAPIFGDVELHWKGKFTDVVWVSLYHDFMSICVTDRMLEVMKQEITIRDYSVYPFTIRKRKKVEGYNLIKFEKGLIEAIDFKNSILTKDNGEYDPSKRVCQVISKTEDEWRALFLNDNIYQDLEYPWRYKFNKLVIKESIKVDLFSLPHLAIRLICSQKFVDMVDRHGFTGMKFEPIETYRYLNYPITEE